ncbi:MAG: hypothetical protein QOH81_962 [Sphingomonadales bacterium]|nr:hypothetical protein [Sphingomonadales bacterium]
MVKAAAVSLGPELVVNGEMNGSTGWIFTVLDGVAPTMAGAMVFDPTFGSDVIATTAAPVISSTGTYRVSWTEGSGANSFFLGGNGGAGSNSGPGSQDVAVTDLGDGGLAWRNEYAGGTVDGLSVKQIL